MEKGKVSISREIHIQNEERKIFDVERSFVKMYGRTFKVLSGSQGGDT